MKPLKRYWIEQTCQFCNLPTTLTKRVFFYSSSDAPEIDFRKKFNEEGMALISVKILEVKESKLTEKHLYAV